MLLQENSYAVIQITLSNAVRVKCLCNGKDVGLLNEGRRLEAGALYEFYINAIACDVVNFSPNVDCTATARLDKRE